MEQESQTLKCPRPPALALISEPQTVRLWLLQDSDLRLDLSPELARLLLRDAVAEVVVLMLLLHHIGHCWGGYLVDYVGLILVALLLFLK